MKNVLISKTSNHFKKLIKSQLKLSYSRNENKDSFSRQSFLNEYRIICLSMIRQSGVTTCISELFDIDHDVYIATNIRQVEIFQELLFAQNKLDNNTKKIKLTSLFRDTLVNIPGYGEQKLNAAYALGGPSLLLETINDTYDIHIDKYVVINFWGFEAIIDQIGGIEVDV